MDLILWRHAEAADGADPAQDFGRKLTARGEKQAQRMAHWLDRQLPQTTRVWVSPAKRAQQTADALGRHAKTRDELGVDASADALLRLVQWPVGKAPILLVGHQPALGQLIAQLLGISGGEVPVRKGSVWWLRHREREGLGQTILWTVQSPDTV
jgi:phosphohistidine phosphatase